MSTAAAKPERDRIDPAVIRIATVVIVGAMAVIFDTTIVSVALPTLARELNTSVATIQWVSTGYLLALGVTIPLVGWGQSRFGGKRLWMFALTVFMIGSILCSLAWSAESLIAFRVLQGIGGGVMLPLMSTLVMQAANGKNLGRIMSAVSLPAVLGPVLGPVLGGLILNSLDWRWLFWVNVPFCVVGFILAWRMLPKDARPTPIRLDLVGLVLLSPGLVGVLYALSNVSQPGAFARADVLIPLIAGAALLVAFAMTATRRGERALVDVRLFRHRPVASASALLFLSGASLYGAMLLLPLYWQEVRGLDALGAGLLLVPQGIGTFFSRSLAGRLTDRIGARAVTFVGFAIVGLATVPFALSGATTNEWVLMGALLLRGFGLGAVTIPLMAVAFIGLERHEVPHASILTRIATQIGGAVGVAVLAVILETAVAAAGGSSGAGGSGVTGGAAAGPGTAALASAFDQAFWWAIGFTVLAMALSFALPGRPGRPAQPAQPEQPELPTQANPAPALPAEPVVSTRPTPTPAAQDSSPMLKG
ncbi:MDR family MFS transporter [Subtercola endophyticus]|uniref:MDR family MFS transporter n=1 Tax=Subtercola endophyticus TaxID=2895559 RepID=UPI001E545DF6|nr:MDR family MFS transporter [Subtercola endophyticus]UFS58430.1 multidrug efflux MFS transporter [Subtercola endophyticus]